MIRPGSRARPKAPVNQADVVIRRLSPANAAPYRDIRLEGLRLVPEAFGSSFAEEQSQPPEWFADRLNNAAVFGAFADGELAGVAGFFQNTRKKEAHKGVLWGMYVRPAWRGSGIGRRLAETVIDHARQHVEILQLTVVTTNHAARRLYTALGFVEYGIEQQAMKDDGQYWDEALMAKSLSRSAAAQA